MQERSRFAAAVQAAIEAYARTGHMLDAALAYAAQGIPVFPLSAHSKAPIPKRNKDAQGMRSSANRRLLQGDVRSCHHSSMVGSHGEPDWRADGAAKWRLVRRCRYQSRSRGRWNCRLASLARETRRFF